MEQLKKGYKKTEVGVIPEDWDLKYLGEVGEVKMCKRIFSYQTKETGQIPFFKIGTFGKEPDAFITRELYDLFRKRFSFPSYGSILISAAGTVGRTIVYNGEDAYFQDSNIVWIENNLKVISNDYLLHVFPKIKFTTEGGTIQRLYNSILKSGMFACPTHSEQKAIADALTDVDELITNLEKLIAKKKAIKQGAMQQLLTPPHKGGKRLEGFSGDWEKVKLGKLGNTFGGLSGKTKRDFVNGMYPYITFLNVMNNTIINRNEFGLVSIKNNEKQNQTQLGDLFFNTSSETPEEVGMCAVLLDEIPNLYLNSFCFGFRLNDRHDISGLFLSYYFNSPVGRQHFLSLAQGATRYNLSKSNFNLIEFYLPIIEEQNAIASFFIDIDIELDLFNKKLKKFQQVKQGMMQELLTGKTRLI